MSLNSLTAKVAGYLRSAVRASLTLLSVALSRLRRRRRSGLDVGTAPQAAPRSTQPNATWTVPQLRAEARARGIEGISRMRKAELIEALRR